jgi:hypothetical protein
MKQCLAIADSVDQMLQGGTLPYIGEDSSVEEDSFPEYDPDPEPPTGSGGPRLKVVK